MEEDFDHTLTAIWLVFGSSYLNHSTAPRYQQDFREQLLVDLLGSYLESELVNSSTNLTQLTAVRDLLQLWSEDLGLIYQIRVSRNNDLQVRQMAQRFLQRIRTFENCIIIPNGLISALHTGPGRSESVSLAILKKQNGFIDWIQVDPGSAYHQHCKHVAGEKSNAYLEITEINPDNITEDWLYLLVGLKAVRLHHESWYYKDVCLYENLLSHLNGKTVFQSRSDEGFIVSSHTSPTHTWHVIDQSFRYLLRHFLGDSYHVVYRRLITNFKLFLIEKTLAAYQDRVACQQIQECHFLLQEMCRDMAQQALDQGNQEQKAMSLERINAVKAVIKQNCSQQEQLLCSKFQLSEAHVSSLSFDPPNLIDHTHSSSIVTSFDLQADPVFVKPSMEDDIIDYLAQLKPNFIDKLINAEDINGVASLCYGIEEFFIGYLAKTNILEKSADAPFSRNDVYLAETLKELAEIYYGCQNQLVYYFLSNVTYQPQFYAKNVTIQFFVYAAVAGLNYRDPTIGPLLAGYNLSVATSRSHSLINTVPHLVIEDSRWVEVLLAVQTFFTTKNHEGTLFSYSEFASSQYITFEVKNNAHETDTEVKFAYELLQKKPDAFRHFTRVYHDLVDEKLNHKWSTLTYTDEYLPALYSVLSKIAYFAKSSLTGLRFTHYRNRATTGWSISRRMDLWPHHYLSEVNFTINNSNVRIDYCSDLLWSYLIKSSYQSGKDPYQVFISCKEKESEGKTRIHFLENEVIANQDKKPETMDSNRYMLLGSLQSEPAIKLERLYVSLKEKQLDFSCKQEAILIKQTLFELSLLMGENISLLEWAAHQTPALIHAFGSLCIEKARAMQYRLSQHHALGDILSVVLGLLTFYPTVYKDSFIEGIVNIYHLLKEILGKPAAHLSDNTLLHLHAYLLIAIQAKPQLLETEALTILKALVAIQNYKVKGSKLDNSLLLKTHVASFTWCCWIQRQLAQDPTLLNGLMLSVIPQWDQGSSWQKSEAGLLFTCNDYAIKPLLGCIYFKNQPISGLPYTITKNLIFKEYLGDASFPVIPASRQLNTQEVPCYSSVDRKPELRLTLIGSTLLIEELIETDFQRYILARELLSNGSYPFLLYESPHNKGKLRHWLYKNESVLIKDEQRHIIFKWDLSSNFLLSLQHEGYVVPWKRIQDSFFKTWLEHIELPGWIELIAKPSSVGSDILIESLNFPRLGLHFDYKQGQFFSKQVHGYVIAEQQHLNTLQGFSSYLVLKKKEENSVRERVKVIIPHRKVISEGSFHAKTTTVDLNNVWSPPYFVYDYDPKMGLLKGHHIRAQLYLALLYFRSASLDDHDASYCNAYHLARENLELCWKDEPYDKVELDIIEQLLNFSAMRSLHSHLVALYLKVMSLLSSSLRLAFLFMDKTPEQNKKRSNELLVRCAKLPVDLLLIYLQNKSSIFARIRLSPNEEDDAAKYSPFLPRKDKICYNNHYREFFSKQKLITTDFLLIFEKHLDSFHFGLDTKGIDFSSGINGILTDRFRIVHFITLYKLAKEASVSLTKYRYLLHHLLIRAKVNHSQVPDVLVAMLARALLLVAENPAAFPDAPSWFVAPSTVTAIIPSVKLSQRRLIKTDVLQGFPTFYWKRQYCLDDDENEKAKKRAMQDDVNENERIWSLLARHDLGNQGIPSWLPENSDNFTLRYESDVSFSNMSKRNKVRALFLSAAYNHFMYKFFSSVLQLCDNLKHKSEMGWTVTPFIYNTITETFMESEEYSLTAPGPVSLVNWKILQQPLINLDNFFAVSSQPAENSDFLFESQLEERQNGYQRKFYTELKDSWSAYTNESNCSYSWLTAQSANELESVLQTKYDEIHSEAEQIWDQITEQFKQRSNSESNDYFALRWYSGQVRHYHKCDILRLLIEPHKLEIYNPDCVEKRDWIIQKLLQYITHEINSAKIVRVLASIEQYKQTEEAAEQFSVLQGLVRGLQENLDPASYQYPHWFLFQFENELIIRDNQRELIVAMLNQTEKAMYQLNMGEGKSSVILPLLTYNLANGKQLLRINVLSALLMTMKEFLRQRFSGLIRKHIYTLPFSRDTDISTEHLELIFKTLQTCQDFKHILLVTPEHRLCLQLKVREFMLENQQQMGATNIFNWKTYRQRAHCKTEVYKYSNENVPKLLKKQDEHLRTCLYDAGYIDSRNCILKVPLRGQGRTEFARFKDIIDNPKFREWSCLKAAYRELLYNSTLAYKDCSEKLVLLNKIGTITAIDLLDESDEILKHGTELNYTMGDKHVFAGGELRWKVPQFFIKTIFCDPEVRNVITAGKSGGFTTINLHFSLQGGVHFIQLLNESYYKEQIKPLLINKFFQENLSTLRKYHCSVDSSLVEGETSSLGDYIAGQLPLNTEKKVMDVLASKGSLKDKLLIAKGWLSHGILFHVFNSKYRVQYGLNLNGSKQIAIPFFGKDAPSPRSEFSHPDVMLGFTIISYLYQGLNQEQLKETLNKLKRKFSHQVADTHLSAWTEAGRAWIEPQIDEFPPLLLTSFQHLDLADEQCLEQVHQYLSGNYMAIFFYLNQFVLLEEAMQYLYKISANAHSLVGYDAALGFSGTDDKKITMPFQIKSLRSKTQEGTNGKLLSVLNQERNGDYHSLQTEDTVELLKKLSEYATKEPHCHALIDAGALVTGLTNYAVAEFLLAHLPSNILGILYFSDEGNSLTVLTQDKKTEALQDCYLDKQYLFAYFDDIHTRGTDIKLPLSCHAILTIGMGMEKDKLMQAAMRLRELAQKQSVSLWGTQAVSLAIARDNSVDVATINSLEVIKWVTQNTIDHINVDLFPVALRKIHFQFLRKAEAWLKEAPTTMNSLIQYCQEKELFELEHFYALSPQREDLTDRLYWFVGTHLRTFWQDFEQELQSKQLMRTVFYEKVFNQSDKSAFRKIIYTICEDLASYLQSGYVCNSLDNDEEREVEVEIIQEQQVLVKVEQRGEIPEKPWDVRLILQENFVTSAEQQNIIMPLNGIKHFIRLPVNLKNIIWHKDIYMTSNFIHTVKCSPYETLDNYLRLVDVVLMHRSTDKSTAVLLSGQEASQIKLTCYQELDLNLLIHINDTDGPSQLPVGSSVSKQELKLLTIVKLFSGECQYMSLKEVHRLAKRIGRLYPQYFTCLDASINFSELFGILVEEGFLDFSGILTEKLLKILRHVKSEESSLNLPEKYQSFDQLLIKKLYGIFSKLITLSSNSLKSNHDILWQWVGTRSRLKEYSGSALESILNSEYEPRCSQ